MTPSADQLISEIAFLKERVQALEKSAFSEPSGYVEGWTEVARFLGVGEKTCRRRREAGQLPEPCGVVTLERESGRTHESPRWRRLDLVRYAENLAAA